MSEFIGGLQNASDYLNRTTVDIPNNVTADLNSGTILTSTTGYSLKEIICSLLAGNGIKLPNLQFCLKINLSRLLNIPGMLAPLHNALSAADAALEKFIAHTNIDNVLARLNAAIAEFAAVANMINFCGTPIQPRPIPNVLRDTMGSFLGQGKDLLDRLGTMLDDDIGGCISLDGKFNANLFTGGLLKELGNWTDDFSSMPANVLDSFVNELNAFSNDIDNLVEFENNFASTKSKGGSTFGSAKTTVHTGVGIAIDTNNLTLSQSQSIAGNLKGAYDSLKGYEVDEAGNNIFHYLLDAELIAKLNDDNDVTVPVQEKQPVYDHCGRVTGYTVTNVQTVQDTSQGAPASPVNTPAADGLVESGVKVSAPPSNTTNLSNTNPIVKTIVPSTPVGVSGDKKGDIRTDGSYIYIAHANYDGVSEIWTRAALQSW
jgi:hypothetical protein